MPSPSDPVFARRPAVIGHRGLGRGVVDGLAENSLASLLAAADAGVDWVELDVSRAADDVLVVHHNPSFGDGQFLVEHSSEQARAAGVPTLAEVFGSLPAHVAVDVDVKPVLEDAVLPLDRGTVGLLVPVLRGEARRRQLLVTSFDAAALVFLRDQVPGLRCGLLTWLDFPLRIAVPMAAHLGMDLIGLHHRSFGPNPVEPGRVHRELARTIAMTHEAGLEVLAWCPGPDEVGPLLDGGVDAVCVNDVPTMLPLVRAGHAS